MNLNRTLRTASLIAGLSVLALDGHAATATGNLGVSATVVSSCIVSGGTINFGSAIDPTVASVPIDANTTLTVQCTPRRPTASP